MYLYMCFFFFFKQKTAYEMRISDWSSDVCSSDLKDALETAENRSAEVTAETYVAVWSDLNTARDAYVAALRASPIYAFFKIETTHRALRDSVNDPANRAPLEALYGNTRSEEHTSELQSLMRTSYAVFFLKNKNHNN